MKPCLRCLCKKEPLRIRAGHDRSLHIRQCPDCGWNQTGDSWADAKEKWEGFKVWELVGKAKVGA